MESPAQELIDICKRDVGERLSELSDTFGLDEEDYTSSSW